MSKQTHRNLTSAMDSTAEADIQKKLAAAERKIADLEVRLAESQDGRLMTGMIGRDSTERKQAEAEIRHLSTFPQWNPNPVIEVNRDGQVIYANAAVQTVLARSGLTDPRSFLPADIETLLSDDSGEEIRQFYREVAIGKQIFGESIYFTPDFDSVRLYATDVTAQRQAEDALRESEARFRLVLKNAPVTVSAQDKNLRFIWAYNQHTVRPEGVIGKTDTDLFPPETADRLTAIKRQVLETGMELRDQFWLVSGGQRIFLELYLEPLRDQAGQIIGVGVASVDLTEIKRAEEALLQAQTELEERVQLRTRELLHTNEQLRVEVDERRRVEESLRQANAYNRSLLEASLDPLVTITQDGKIGDVNQATEAVTGCRREELVDTDFHEYFTDPEKARAGYRQVFETGTVRDYELEILHKDGHITPVLYNASIYRDEAGNITGIFAAARDISERKQSEKQLQLLTTALESAANGVFITNRKGDIIWSNPALAHMTGYSSQEMIGQNPRMLKSGSHDEAYYQRMWEAILSGQVWRGELTNRRKDGSLYTEEQTITPVRDKAGNITHFIAIKQDITDRKRVEQALEEERQQLIQSEKFTAMGRLLASITHELNNPLQTIKNCLFLCQSDLPPYSPVIEFLNMATSETERLANLVAQLREVYRPRQAGQTTPVQIPALLSDVHKLLGTHIRDRHVQWIQDTANNVDLSRLIVNGNADQIKQVFLNIGMNAIEAILPEGGKLMVDIMLSKDDRQVGVKFQDTGPGIPAEEIPKIFEPFHTTKSKGLGLGLPICYDILQRHNGNITVESQPGQGAVFTVWLPLIDPVSSNA